MFHSPLQFINGEKNKSNSCQSLLNHMSVSEVSSIFLYSLCTWELCSLTSNSFLIFWSVLAESKVKKQKYQFYRNQCLTCSHYSIFIFNWKEQKIITKASWRMRKTGESRHFKWNPVSCKGIYLNITYCNCG